MEGWFRILADETMTMKRCGDVKINGRCWREIIKYVCVKRGQTYFYVVLTLAMSHRSVCPSSHPRGAVARSWDEV